MTEFHKFELEKARKLYIFILHLTSCSAQFYIRFSLFQNENWRNFFVVLSTFINFFYEIQVLRDLEDAFFLVIGFVKWETMYRHFLIQTC